MEAIKVDGIVVFEDAIEIHNWLESTFYQGEITIELDGVKYTMDQLKKIIKGEK